MEFILALLITFSSMYYQHNKPFVAEGPSMEPTLHAQDRMNVDTTYYQNHSFQRGDIIIFHATKEKDYVKRIIALPGETVRVEGDNVYINNQLLKEPYLRTVLDAAAQKGTTYNSRNFSEKTVPEGTVFVLGDNRSNSLDSRDAMIGFVKFENIVGKAVKISGTEVGEIHE